MATLCLSCERVWRVSGEADCQQLIGVDGCEYRPAYLSRKCERTVYVEEADCVCNGTI